MARKKRSNENQPIGIGMTVKQMKRRKPVNTDFLLDITPASDNQKKFFDAYQSDKHLFVYGCA